MVISCSAYKCTSRFKKDSSISFHSFPKNELIRQKWVNALKRENYQPSSAKLCSKHFQSSDFFRQFGQKKLNPDAVPSIFDFPSNPTKSTQTRRPNKTQITKSEPLEDDIAPIPSSSHSSLVITDMVPKNELNKVFVPGTSTNAQIIQGKVKRKRDVPVYLGDFDENDMNDARKAKKMWKMAREAVQKQRKTVKYLRTKNYRLQKKITTILNALIKTQDETKGGTSSQSHLLLKNEDSDDSDQTSYQSDSSCQENEPKLIKKEENSSTSTCFYPEETGLPSEPSMDIKETIIIKQEVETTSNLSQDKYENTFEDVKYLMDTAIKEEPKYSYSDDNDREHFSKVIVKDEPQSPRSRSGDGDDRISDETEFKHDTEN